MECACVYVCETERELVETEGVETQRMEYAVVKIFVHRWKTERIVRKCNVQRCTCTWYIYVNNKGRVRC